MILEFYRQFDLFHALYPPKASESSDFVMLSGGIENAMKRVNGIRKAGNI